MLHISIDVYKASGKWYTSGEAANPTDIPIWDEDTFREFLCSNLPARIGEGYIVVKDFPDGDGFHNHVYQYAEVVGGNEKLFVKEN